MLTSDWSKKKKKKLGKFHPTVFVEHLGKLSIDSKEAEDRSEWNFQ